MKTIIIRLPDVEAAMLAEVQKKNMEVKDLQADSPGIPEDLCLAVL